MVCSAKFLSHVAVKIKHVLQCFLRVAVKEWHVLNWLLSGCSSDVACNIFSRVAEKVCHVLQCFLFLAIYLKCGIFCNVFHIVVIEWYVLECIFLCYSLNVACSAMLEWYVLECIFLCYSLNVACSAMFYFSC